jgi:hypothetical protein
MTTITLNLSSDLEQKLRIEAAKEGIDPDSYVVNALQERLQSNPILDEAATEATEADLLQQINIGFSADTWEQYHTLIAKRHAETLSPEEHKALIQLSDRLEKLNAARIQALIRLAKLRNQSLSDLMQTLGISPNPEVLNDA